MVKALIAICVLQTALLVLLLSRVIMLEDGVATFPSNAPAIIHSQPSPAAQPSILPVASFPDEAQLRTIIGEELAAQLSGSFLAATPADSVPDSGPPYEHRRASVVQTVDYHISMGTISAMDMARLQHDIALLNAEDSRAVFAKIVSALHDGQLDGRL